MLKRLLMETDFEKLKNLVSKVEDLEIMEIPGFDERLRRLPVDLNSAGFDRWGLHPESLRRFAPFMYILYKKYTWGFVKTGNRETGKNEIWETVKRGKRETGKISFHKLIHRPN